MWVEKKREKEISRSWVLGVKFYPTNQQKKDDAEKL